MTTSTILRLAALGIAAGAPAAYDLLAVGLHQAACKRCRRREPQLFLLLA